MIKRNKNENDVIDTEAKTNKLGSTAEQIDKWVKDSIAYQDALGLRRSAPECVRFLEGEQWPTATERTRNFPRPVINVIEMICNNKKAQVLSSPIKLVYKSKDAGASVDKFNRFAECQQRRLQVDEINNELALDGETKGSYGEYWFWDSEVNDLDGLKSGDLDVQTFDVCDIHFANPREKNEQKQEWIIIVSREGIDKVKELADENVDVTKLCDDENESIYNERESETTKYVTVYTRFFRKNGEVYFERATRQTIFQKARPLTPNPEQIKKQIEGIEEETPEEKPEDKFIAKPKITLYPIVFTSWKKRNQSIYGRGEVEGLIANQKAINNNWALQLLMAQNEAMSRTIVHPNALKGQKLTNEPGQVVVDYSNTGKGIQKEQPTPMSQASISVADKLIEVTRVASASSEVTSGEVISANMSGAAIAQLQSQALKQIQDLQKGFWRHVKKRGKILEQFLRFYYADREFEYTEGGGGEIKSDAFNSADYNDTRFSVDTEAVAGTVMGDVGDINVLDNLLAKQMIPLSTYIECYPENAIACRQKLLDAVNKEQTNAVTMLNAKLQEQQAQLQQMAQTLKADEQSIQNAKMLIDENKTLKEKLLQLQAEYTQKIQTANQILESQGEKYREAQSDAQTLANIVRRQGGIRPPQNMARPTPPLPPRPPMHTQMPQEATQQVISPKG